MMQMRLSKMCAEKSVKTERAAWLEFAARLKQTYHGAVFGYVN